MAEIKISDDLDSYEWFIAESKGYLSGVPVSVDGHIVRVSFYDPVRLSQDVEDGLKAGLVPCWKRLLVVERISFENLKAAIGAAPEEFFL